jgi:hypothetical protein
MGYKVKAITTFYKPGYIECISQENIEKMKQVINIVIFAAIFLTAISCKEDAIEVYHGPDLVNILAEEGDGVFVQDEEMTEKTFSILLRAQSVMSDKDRVIKIGYGEKQTAKKGVHFNMPDEVILEAGRVDTVVNCTVYKEHLTFDPLLIDFRILPSDDFEGGGIYNSLEVKVMIGFPTQWRDPTGWAANWALGPCTQAKYKFVYEMIGTLDLSAYRADYYQSLKRLLNEELAKNPRLDDDGSPMRFGS